MMTGKRISRITVWALTFSDGSSVTLFYGTDGADGADGRDGSDGKNGTIMHTLVCQESQLVRVDHDSVDIIKEGGELDFHYRTNTPVSKQLLFIR